VPFPDGDFTPANSGRAIPFGQLRWSKLRELGSAQELFDTVNDFVFPFLRERAEDTSHAAHMEGARLTIPTPALLQKAVDGLDAIPMEDRDTKGDVYEYMLAKIASAGQNGQFRTPRHIIQLMVEMMAPTPTDTICDPASGTCGFLVAASEYIRDNSGDAPVDWDHFNSAMFSGFDFDNTMLRIGSMNMQLHGVASPNIAYRDSLSEEAPKDDEAYSLILANPPFAGSLDYDGTAKDLQAIAKTKKTELLFLSLFLRLLKPGGRAAVIVPDGVLFGSTKAHKELRRILVEEQKLDGIVSLPSGVFKPYAGVSTAILLFTKTTPLGSGLDGGTDNVWFYDLAADGYSLDDKRTPQLDDAKLGPNAELADDEHERNNLPDAFTRWQQRNDATEVERARTEQSFCVPKAEIAENDYDLSINRYKEIVYEQIDYPAPSEIIAELETIEAEITQGLAELKAMLR
jgi:type I restriction enzyme M protein